MNDDFEQRLQRQPLRRLPGEWRAEILQPASAPRHSTPDTLARRSDAKAARPSLLSTLNSRLSTLLWPHPKAWAGLAALWIAIAAVQFAASDRPVHVAKNVESPSVDALVVLRQQTRLMAELAGQAPSREADRPKPNTPQPRSERESKISFV